MNAADFDLLNRISIVDAQLKALQAELERVIIDNHLLREENERLRRERPEALR
jgi:regulator of replication initiation timing